MSAGASVAARSPSSGQAPQSQDGGGRRRILHVVGDSAFGGGSRIILAIAVRAQRAGYGVDIFTTDARFQQACKEFGIRVVEPGIIPRAIKPAHDLLSLLQLWRFLERERYDVVHTHTSKAGIIGRLAARISHASTVVHTMHGFAYRDTSPRLIKAAALLAEGLAGRWCHAVVTVATYQAEFLTSRKILPTSRVLAIPNGVPDPSPLPASARNRLRAQFGVKSQETLLICHGRLAKMKGVDVLLDSIALLKQRGVTLVCLVVGEGPAREELELQTSILNISEQVRFIGFRDDVSDLLAAGDMVVLPSLREGLSIALLEAMATGTPIIATTIPGNVEAAPDGSALLVPPGDPELLAVAIDRVLGSPTRLHELARAARDRFESAYREESMTDAYLELYKRLGAAP